MRKAYEVARSGLFAVALHPLRSAATVACVVAVLVPIVVGLALSAGVREEARESVEAGPDLVVVGRRLGRDVPLPVASLDAIRAIPGVREVVPRIVGEVTLGRDGVPAVLVGLPTPRLSARDAIVRGRAFAPGLSREIVVGTRLARRLALDVGSRIPPFYRNEAGEHVTTVFGVFEPDLPLWQANVVFTSFETASEVFATNGLATNALVSCAPGYVEAVRTTVERLPDLGAGDPRGPIAPAVVTRGDLEARLERSSVRREGAFALHFVLALAAAIPLLLVVSGVGLSERRREVGLLKATGWQTDDVLVRSFAESAALSVVAAATSVVVAWVWLRLFHGAGLLGVFLTGLDATPDVDPPFVLEGGPLFVALALSFALVAVGSLGASWRSATASPVEAMR